MWLFASSPCASFEPLQYPLAWLLQLRNLVSVGKGQLKVVSVQRKGSMEVVS